MKNLAWLAAMLSLAVCVSVRAATYTVTNTNDGGVGSLRRAISDANSNAGADTIVFDTAGTFNTSQTITLTTGQLVITGAVTIDAPSPAAQRVHVSANHVSRVLRVELTGAGTVTLRYLDLRYGTVTDDGGGVQMASPAGSTLALVGCSIFSCDARDGAGIDGQDATVVLTDCDLNGNDATRNGGGIYCRGTLTTTGGLFQYNSAATNGGGIYASAATSTMTNTDVVGNTAVLGGGIFVTGGTLAFIDGAMVYNVASGNGGGLRAAASSNVTLLRSAISMNEGDSGGGFDVRSSTVEATNCTIAKNECHTSGGGVHFQSGTVRLKNCTVSGNMGSADSEGIRAETGGMSLGNTVVAENPVYAGAGISGSFLSLGHNLIGYQSVATGFTNGVDGDIVGADAGLGSLPTPYGFYTPQPGSRCLEAGDSSLVTNPPYGPPPFVDQAGNPRIRGVVDIGAIEGALTAVVTNDADSGAGSLRDAFASSPTEISFDPGYFGSVLRTVTLTSGQITISSNITITGPELGVKVSASNSSRAFTVTGGAVTFRHLRVIDGNSTADGGGIRVINAGTSLTLDDAGVSNCVAAGRGGGIYIQDAATLSITSSTVSGNVADDNGGGINIGTGGPTFALTNSTISGNSSKQAGGGIYVATGASTIINCTIAENNADSDNVAPAGNGGGVRRNGGTVNVGNTIIAKNTDVSTATNQPDVSGTFVSLGHNLIGKTDGLDTGNGTPFQNGVNGDQAGTIASPINPQLGALAQVPANSPTRVHPLLPASPARDAGDPVLLTNAAWQSTPVAEDQRGQFRIVGTAVDIGAVEYPDTNLAKLSTDANLTSEQTLQPVAFRIRRSYDTGAALVLNLSLDPSTTASAADYNLSGASYTVTGPTTFTVTIPAGKISVLLTLTPLNDNVAEGTEIVAITLAAAAGYALDASEMNTRTVSIYDNEATVTSTANAGAGSLREAINNANTGGGGVITMPQSGVVTLNGTPLSIASEIEINGNNSTIDAAGLSRVLSVQNNGGTTVVLRNLILAGGNAPDYGGGVDIFAYSTVELRGCTVRNNFAPTGGGGIFADYASSLTLTNSSLVDNSTNGFGGGLYTSEVSSLLGTNVTVAGNSARESGGGLYFANTTFQILELTNWTFTENLADSNSDGSGNGGGIAGLSNSTLGLYNTVIAGNSDTPGNAGPAPLNPDLSGVFPFPSHCFVGINAGAIAYFPAGAPGPSGNYAGTLATPRDAQLYRITKPTDIYYEFNYGSQLADHGDNGFVSTATDQRGLGRIYNGTVDIGAVEMDFVPVSNTSDTGAGSLRQAVATAVAQGHGTIVFAPNVFNTPQTIALTSGELDIAGSMIVSAPSNPASRLTISASTLSRILKVAPAASATLELRNLNLSDGNTAGYPPGNRFGAGLLIGANARLNMSNCEVRNCNALGDGGAASIAAGGALDALDCTFASNHSAAQGGAIATAGTFTLARVTLSDNTADAEGGGIANAHLGGLTNCTLSNNRANNHGGAIYNIAGAADTLALTHCTLTLNRSNNDNTGGGDGGGIRRVSGVVNVRNTLISGNDAVAGTQDDLSGTFTSLGNNLIGIIAGSTGFTNGVNGDLVGANPYLGALRNNGGPTFTHALGAASAAVNTASIVSGLTDQRGLARTATAPDMGAYELQPESYTYWSAHEFPSAINSGSLADYDGDGVANGLEYVAGSDARSPGSLPEFVPSVSGGQFWITFAVSPLAVANFAFVSLSPNLLTWTPAALGNYSNAGFSSSGANNLLRVTVPVGTPPRMFGRLELLP